MQPTFKYANNNDGSVFVWNDYHGESGGCDVTVQQFEGFRYVIEALGYDLDETELEDEEADEDDPVFDALDDEEADEETDAN